MTQQEIRETVQGLIKGIDKDGKYCTFSLGLVGIPKIIRGLEDYYGKGKIHCFIVYCPYKKPLYDFQAQYELTP